MRKYFTGSTIQSLLCVPQRILTNSIFFVAASSRPSSCLQCWNWPFEEASEPFLSSAIKIPHAATSIKCLPHPSSVQADHLILATTNTGSVSLFDLKFDTGTKSFSEISTHCFHSGAATALDILSGDTRFVSVGEDGVIHCADIESLRVIQSFSQDPDSAINTVHSLSPFTFATALAHSSEVHIWDARTTSGLVRILQYPKHSIPDMHCCIWSIDHHPDKSWLLCHGLSGLFVQSNSSLVFHDLRASQLYPIFVNNSLHNNHIWQVKFHPTKPDYIFSASEDGSLVMWDFSTFSDQPYRQSLESSSVRNPSIRHQGQQNGRKIINYVASIECFDIDSGHNAIISSTEDESIIFNLGSSF
ncbi:nucleoporin Nup43-like [Schistocerca gregaria]|uniref:nucleoporin Nup43-like n=1 Tax=Schistocerca gregaria TaxID=7010 RepID=UPI00211DF11F|nr:nucleoporin Nup43-like [Schistocerca gregaria]